MKTLLALVCAGTVTLFAVGAPSVRAAVYPVDAHGSIAVDLVRHFVGPGLTSTATTANNVFTGDPGTASLSINGGGQKTQWQVAAANRAASSASLRVTLDDVYSINQIVSRTRFLTPDTLDLRVSATGFGSLNTIATGVTATAGDNPFYFAAQPVKYIEVTWHGAHAFDPSFSYTDIQRITAFADAATTPPINILSGFNIRGAITPTFTNDSAAAGGGGWLDGLANIWDGDIENSYIRGNASGLDARFVSNLGSIQHIRNVTLGFYDDQNWGFGGRVELSTDGVNWTQVFNQTSALGTTNITLAGVYGMDAQFIRVTNFKSAGGAMTEMEVELVPEPASLAMAGLGAAALFGARRPSRQFRNR
jgi:hypothetical protein